MDNGTVLRGFDNKLLIYAGEQSWPTGLERSFSLTLLESLGVQSPQLSKFYAPRDMANTNNSEI